MLNFNHTVQIVGWLQYSFYGIRIFRMATVMIIMPSFNFKVTGAGCRAESLKNMLLLALPDTTTE